MINVYGGNQKFEAKLDEMFNSESKTTGREQADVTGLIGQYAHGNEPSHHMAYLYNYVGKHEKTTEKVHFILNNFYKNAPDGLIGNEDCGQMSAWYVLSSMGIYDVTPGQKSWSTTIPNFDKIKVNFENKSTKEITKTTDEFDLRTFDMDDKDFDDAPFMEASLEYDSGKEAPQIIPVPVIQAESKAFKDSTIIKIENNNSDKEVVKHISTFYKIGDEKDFKLYTQPIEISTSSTIYAYSKTDYNGFSPSNTISATFFKKPNNYTIDIKSKYNPQYHAGGPDGLLDGINGTENWRKGDWQGYQGQDFEATVDLQQEKNITTFGATFLQDSRSWILMPTKVEYYVSSDNINFTLAGTIENKLDPKDTENTIQKFVFDKELKAKYVKIKAYNFGKLPEWHQGAGGEAFIFIDEITIK